MADKCDPNPDIAGIGVSLPEQPNPKPLIKPASNPTAQVIVSFLLTAGLALFLAQFCIWANLLTDKEKPPEWLHNHLPERLLQDSFRKALERRQAISESLIIGLSLSQAITGAAILLCATITYEVSSQNPYFFLALTLATLAMWTEVPMLFALRHAAQASLVLRTLFIALFSFCLGLSAIISAGRRNGGALAGSVLILFASTGFLVPTVSYMVGLTRSKTGRKSAWISWQEPVKNFYISKLAHPSVRFVMVEAMTAFVVFIFVECIVARRHLMEECHSSQAQNNQWTFGQFLALFMVTGVVFSTWDAYFAMCLPALLSSAHGFESLRHTSVSGGSGLIVSVVEKDD